jgi:hypothetical protein
MDSYLERHWGDVHAKLVTYASDDLNTKLPPELIARVEERTAIETESAEHRGSRRNIVPDARVFEAVGENGAGAASAGGVVLAPYRLVLMDEPTTEHFVEIIDTRGGERLVTVLEFVSPANKIGKGLKAFITKREELLAGGVNFVEIDLVREGDREQLFLPHACPANLCCEYRSVTRVPNDPLAVWVQPIPLREALPAIQVPLRLSDLPCALALQPLFEQVYRNSRYERTLDYRKPADPPLEGEDAAWADALLRAAGRR